MTSSLCTTENIAIHSPITQGFVRHSHSKGLFLPSKKSLNVSVGLQGARRQLEKAEALAAAGGFGVADWEVAEHRLRLGRAHWELGDAAAGEAGKASRKQAAALWLQAAAVEGPHQVGTCHALLAIPL